MSEVVGSVLLLLMTVTVFSGIIIFVNSIQGPGNQTFVDLIPSIERTDANNGIIMITHAGGHPLDASTTAIIVAVNSTRYQLTVADGLTPSNGQWATGQRWAVPFGGNTLSQNATVQLTVIDLNTNQIVLLSLVQRGIGTGGTFPIVGTAVVLPNGFVFNSGNDAFRIRVVAADYDNDLPQGGVRVNMASLGCNVSNQTLVNTGFGIFESPAASFITSCVSPGVYLLNVTATDLAGHSSTAILQFRVVRPPTIIPPGSTGTGPFGWFFSSEFQAYEIFNGSEWAANRYNGNGTRTFVKGETVVVVVASQYIKNLDLQNDMNVYGTTPLPIRPIVYGNSPYMDPVTTSSTPSSKSAFDFEEFIGGFFVFKAEFVTDSSSMGFDGVQLAYGHYTLEMTLRADNVPTPRNRFSTQDEILVTDAAGDAPNYPTLEFFEDSALTQPSNLYHFTDTVFVRLTVRTTDASFVFGDIIIADYIGGSQVWAKPGNSPVDTASISTSTSYSFSVDLSDPNNDPWVFGQNAYAFKVKQFVDVDEQYAVAEQIIVQGPEWGLDVVAAIEEYGHPVHSEKWYATFYENDQLWSRTVIELYESAPSQQTPPFGGGKFYDVAFTDYDEDGDLDALIGIEKGYVFLYRNVIGDGTAWERAEIDNLGGVPVLSVAAGRIDADLDDDFVAGTSGGEIWAYNNDGAWTPTLVADLNSEINKIVVAEVTGDGLNDLVIGTKTGSIRVYINDGAGGFGTLQTADYLMVADAAVQGTVTGTYALTQSSNDGYQTVREVNGTGEQITIYTAVDEFIPAYGLVESGTYANTLADDGAPFEVLAERFYDGAALADRWMIRNSTAGAAPGHQYAFGTIPGLGAGDVAYVTVNAFLSAGTEPMEIRYKVGGGAVSSLLGTISETTEVTKTFPLPGFSGGDLYIVIQDSDLSNSDQNTDAKQTKISVDLVEVGVIKQTGTTSRLEHKWQTAAIGSGGAAYRVFVEGFHTVNDEEDDFLLQWGPASTGPWSNLVLLTKTADDDIPQTAVLPTSVGGTQIYFRLVDSNRAVNATDQDTIRIDHIFVRRYIPVPNFQSIAAGGEVHDLVVGDIDGNGHKDIVTGAGSSVKVFFGPSWATTRSLSADTMVLTVGVGHVNGDTNLDIFAGTDGLKLFYWENGGSWTRTLLADLSAPALGKPISMGVADVDSDLWDDVVVGTESGYIMWFRHVKGTSWSVSQVENLGKPIYGLALGDADRGIILSYA